MKRVLSSKWVGLETLRQKSKQLFSSKSPWNYIRQSLSEGDWLLVANIAEEKQAGNIIKLVQFNSHEQLPAHLVAQLVITALVIQRPWVQIPAR